MKTNKQYIVESTREREMVPTERGRSLSTSYCLLSTEKGIALVMVLILAAISLAIMAALIYMITVSTQVSGIQKRYRTALEAGKGGASVAFQTIGAGGDPNLGLANFSIPSMNVGGTDCFTAKLNSATADWPKDGSGNDICSTSFNIDPTQPSSYDWSFQLGSTAAYDVYAKIVDTVNGNSSRTVDAGAMLQKAGVVNANSGEVPVKSYPYIYTIEIQAVNSGNTTEKADYSVLYEY
jgi:hypothetical protein